MIKKLNKKKKILVIVGGFLLISLMFILFTGWEDFKITAGVILGSEVAELQKMCKTQCQLENVTGFCCNAKWINEYDYHTCQDKLLETNCELNCEGICEAYCAGYTNMLYCARVGCTWLPKYKICRARSR